MRAALFTHVDEVVVDLSFHGLPLRAFAAGAVGIPLGKMPEDGQLALA